MKTFNCAQLLTLSSNLSYAAFLFHSAAQAAYAALNPANVQAPSSSRRSYDSKRLASRCCRDLPKEPTALLPIDIGCRSNPNDRVATPLAPP
jgi:hypothetical protein